MATILRTWKSKWTIVNSEEVFSHAQITYRLAQGPTLTVFITEEIDEQELAGFHTCYSIDPFANHVVWHADIFTTLENAQKNAEEHLEEWYNKLVKASKKRTRHQRGAGISFSIYD